MGGALGGLLGALLAHGAVLELVGRFEGADHWLKGPHGPPFFALALHSAVYFAGVGAGVGTGRGRAVGAAAAAGTAWGCLALPLAVAGRLFVWGEEPGPGGETLAWFYLVLAGHAASQAAAAFLAGAWAKGRFDGRAGAGALAGAGLGYAAGLASARLAPDLRLMPAGVALDGLLSGLCIGIGAASAERRRAGGEHGEAYVHVDAHGAR